MNLDRYRFDQVETEISRFADEHAISVFSLRPGFAEKNAAELWVVPGDQHPNPQAHRIAADTLYPYLVAALSHLPKAPRSTPN
jgi:hypothetical protein